MSNRVNEVEKINDESLTRRINGCFSAWHSDDPHLEELSMIFSAAMPRLDNLSYLLLSHTLNASRSILKYPVLLCTTVNRLKVFSSYHHLPEPDC